MPAVKGGGKLQQAILASLDGQPRAARDVIIELVGGEPTELEYNSAHRATRSLVASGQLRAWLDHGPRRPPHLVLLKVDRWISDGDSGTASERQQAVDPLQRFVDEAWLAFATDCGYASDIAMAARALADNPRDTDIAHAAERARWLCLVPPSGVEQVGEARPATAAPGRASSCPATDDTGVWP
jgi:hypothetical protein